MAVIVTIYYSATDGYSIQTVPATNPSVPANGDINIALNTSVSGNAWVIFDQAMNENGQSVPANTAVEVSRGRTMPTFNPPSQTNNYTANVSAGGSSSGPWCTAHAIIINHGGTGGA